MADHDAAIGTDYRRLKSSIKVAIKHGVSKPTVLRTLHRSGVEVRKPGRPKDEGLEADIRWGGCGTPGCPDEDCDVPYGDCHCGCGEPAPTADKSDRERCYVKGKPRLYKVGHSRRAGTVAARGDGQPLRAARLQAGLTMRALSLDCDLAPKIVSELEGYVGRRVTIASAERIAERLDVSFDKLFTRDVAPPGLRRPDLAFVRTRPPMPRPERPSCWNDPESAFDRRMAVWGHRGKEYARRAAADLKAGLRRRRGGARPKTALYARWLAMAEGKDAELEELLADAGMIRNRVLALLDWQRHPEDWPRAKWPPSKHDPEDLDPLYLPGAQERVRKGLQNARKKLKLP